MPLWLPPSVPGRYLANAANVTVTAGSSAHTKGSWTQLVSSTSADAYGLYVMAAGVAANAADSATLMDIGIGASGSEQVIIPDLNVGGAFARNRWGKFCFIPLYIPSGSRISARAQSVAASKAFTVDLYLVGDPPGPMPVATQVTALGVVSSASRGTTISANNAWTEIVASSSQNYWGWLVMPGQAGDTTLQGTAPLTIEVGIGASGSETSIGLWNWATTTAEEILGPFPPVCYYRQVPAGTRIAVRQNDTEARDAVVYALS